jgi:hypothetical protein
MPNAEESASWIRQGTRPAWAERGVAPLIAGSRPCRPSLHDCPLVRLVAPVETRANRSAADAGRGVG